MKLALLLTLVASSVLAEDAVPPIVKAGFDAFAAKGPEAAWTAWDLDHVDKLDGDKTQFVSLLSKAQKDYGAVQGYELIHSNEVSASYKNVYVLWRFQKKPFFCMFVCYRGEREWKIINFFFGSDPRVFLPASILQVPSK